MNTRYRFLTEFEISSSPDAIEETLRDVGNWSAWWKWARRIEPTTSDHGVVGARYRNRIATPLLYGFSYETEIVEVTDELIRLDVSGDLRGTGVFRFRATQSGGSFLSFEWSVATQKRWMNILAPLARPIFTWNHHRIMSDFGEGLGKASDGELLHTRHAAIPSPEPRTASDS